VVKARVFHINVNGLPSRIVKDRYPGDEFENLSEDFEEQATHPGLARLVDEFRKQPPKPLPQSEAQLLLRMSEVRNLISGIKAAATSLSLNHSLKTRDFFNGDGFANFIVEYERNLPERIIEHLNESERKRLQQANFWLSFPLLLSMKDTPDEVSARGALAGFFRDLINVYTSLMDRMEASLDIVISNSPVPSTQMLSIAEGDSTAAEHRPGEKISRNYIRKEVDPPKSGRGRRTDLKTLGVVHLLDSYSEQGMDRKTAISEILRKYSLSEESVRKVFDKHFKESSPSTD